MSDLKRCPFCGGEAVLVEMYESCDGRCDRFPRVKCTDCQAEVGLTFKAFTDATHEYGYTGGYYSQNKKVWDGIHQKVVDKWNNRKPVDDVLEQLKTLVEKCMINSEKATELGPKYEKHIVLNDAKRIAFEQAIEIIKEELM